MPTYMLIITCEYCTCKPFADRFPRVTSNFNANSPCRLRQDLHQKRERCEIHHYSSSLCRPGVSRVHLPPRPSHATCPQPQKRLCWQTRKPCLAKPQLVMVIYYPVIAGVAQWLELQPSKLVVEGSNPFARCPRHAETSVANRRQLRQHQSLARPPAPGPAFCQSATIATYVANPGTLSCTKTVTPRPPGAPSRSPAGQAPIKPNGLG